MEIVCDANHGRFGDAIFCFRDAIVCYGGPVYEIEVRGRLWLFEAPYSCGLVPLNKDGSPRQSPWPGFVWDAVQLWEDQGKRIDGDRCVWTDDPVELARIKRERIYHKKTGEILSFRKVGHD